RTGPPRAKRRLPARARPSPAASRSRRRRRHRRLPRSRLRNRTPKPKRRPPPPARLRPAASRSRRRRRNRRPPRLRSRNKTPKPKRRPRRVESREVDPARPALWLRSEEHTSELQSLTNLVCRLLLEKKKTPTRGERKQPD